MFFALNGLYAFSPLSFMTTDPPFGSIPKIAGWIVALKPISLAS